MDNVILIMITIFVVAAVAVTVTLNIIQSQGIRKVKRRLSNLEIEKNAIDSTPIIPELNKIESFFKSEQLDLMQVEWKKRLENIKNIMLPEITDMLLEAEYFLSKLDYKNAYYETAKLELAIEKAKTASKFLLDEIKEVTGSEEKNRAIVTDLKAKYRELYSKFNETRTDFAEYDKVVSMQFENITDRFEEFEREMEKNNYTEINKIIKAIDEMLKHMTVVIEETPMIVMMAKNLLPKQIENVKATYKKLTDEGYPLEYLNVEYNIEEAEKKTSDILDRLRILNLEDSVFELKVLSEYFDNVFNDFEKEKVTKEMYLESTNVFEAKLNRISKIIEEVFSGLTELTKAYNLKETDIKILEDVKKDLAKVVDDYDLLKTHLETGNFAYTQLSKELEGLTLKLVDIEGRLEATLSIIGNLKEDELRAREQLEEVKIIYKESENKINNYNLPLLPTYYQIEKDEAKEAILEIEKELSKSPITVEVLNIRVDTARDLALKLHTATSNMIKTAQLSEMAIVYGNRFRPEFPELDKNLNYSEILFYNGEYKKSLDLSINSLNKIEPGINEKLTNLFNK